ncbi:MAG TPA: tubulin-like doman-containing protein [Chitinophagales bacterium]|nr:tubulin-like doman-containing protein [Chitinophagales bacterium]HRK26712.1 tubulin-like doman-containing protein [Chitinophagales bacterium]
MSNVPTILIGLGGLGSQIVDRIYSWIPKHRRGFVAVHAFDTNVNDISKLKFLNRENITQTSTNWTVAEYLRMAGDTVKDWFPYEQQEILRKSLTDGAGQIRSVSRLAYRAAMESNKLGNLHNSINHIFRETGSDSSSSARVMIVSSLVGGTGSGIFLQTAMYMRDVLEFDFQRRNVLIRGAFLLPDAFVLTNVIKGDEVENIRANAYASVKELNAITRNASGNSGDQGVTIELEYKPNQVDAQGRLQHEITSRNLPYNFAFMFDFENTEKNNLKELSNYINQVARTTYLDLFSPMANDRFSKQDNQILTLIEKQGMNRYCGAGVSALQYPYDDIVYYCALRWSTDSLGNDWLRIDEQFDAEMKQYELDLKNGITRTKPILRDRYREILKSFAEQQNPRPFYKLAFRSVHTIDKQEQLDRPKAELFLEEVLRRIENTVNSNERLNTLRSECDLDENRLKDKITAINEVSKCETALYAYEQAVRKFIMETRNQLLNEIVLQDFDHPQKLSGDDYKLNTWMLKKTDPLHPVAVRYFFYHIDFLLHQKIQELTPLNERLNQAIDAYKRAYDIDETEDVIETAEDRIRRAIKQGFFGGLFANEFKSFREEYIDKSSRHKNRLDNYRKESLTEMVLKELQKAVQEMQQDWEKYFRNLKDTRNSLQNELDRLAIKHENASDPTIKYVLATKQQKELAWENIRIRVGSDELPTEISAEIYKGQYLRFGKFRKGEYITDVTTEKIEEMYRKDVVNWCISQLYKEDSLNLNCVRAIRREAQLTNTPDTEVDRYIRNRIAVLNNLARPFVPASPGSTEINAWGIHPDANTEFSGVARQEIFQESDMVIDEAFSAYEIIRNRTIFGLTIQQLPKFSGGDDKGRQPGEYYKAYTSRIIKLTVQGNTVTPHLDKRWHLPAYLPPIDPEQVPIEEKRINRALIWGLIMGYLQNLNEWGKITWLFSDDTGSRLITINEKTIDRYVHTLRTALLHNPIIVDKILQRAAEQQQRDSTDYLDVMDKHAFYKKAQNIYYAAASSETGINILDLILRYPDGSPGNVDLVNRGEELLKLLLQEIYAYFLQVYGAYREVMAKEKCEAFIDDLIAKSLKYQQADKMSVQFKRWDNIITQAKTAKNG